MPGVEEKGIPIKVEIKENQPKANLTEVVLSHVAEEVSTTGGLSVDTRVMLYAWAGQVITDSDEKNSISINQIISQFGGIPIEEQRAGRLPELGEEEIAVIRYVLRRADQGEFDERAINLMLPLVGRQVEGGSGRTINEEIKGILQLAKKKKEDFLRNQPKVLEATKIKPAVPKPVVRPATSFQETDTFRLGEISPTEAEKILQLTEIHGNSFRGQNLTTEILRREGLLPKYKVNIEGSVVWLSSKAYKADSDGRIAVVGYVKDKDHYIARTFYQSLSQGIWRYLPNYRLKNGNIDWYGKGHGEESICLPIALQKALAEISRDQQQILTLRNPELIFAGTARLIDRRNTFLVEVHKEEILDGNFYSTNSIKINPEQVQFRNPAQKPDFSRILTSWSQRSHLYNGDIRVEVYASADKRLKYMFCRDIQGRTWIGGVENSSRLTSVGVRESWVNAGDLATPAYEYASQAIVYGDVNNKSGHYLDMYKNYLSKIPIIKEYLAYKQR